MSIEHLRRRADECRCLAIDARNPSDKAFWLGLVKRWQALGSQRPYKLCETVPERRVDDNPYWLWPIDHPSRA
jgi:hypothetical protein